MPVKIFVGNLQVESNRETETALKQLFEQFGRVVECDILTGKNFGFVHMENDSDANIAIAALHGEEFFGGQINVEKSDNQGKGKKPPRGGGGGGMRGGGGGGMRGGGRGGSVFGRGGGAGGGRGRGRGGMERGRGRGGGPGTIGDRRPPPRYDPYARNGAAAAARDPYEREPYSLPPSRTRDPYAREVYARDPYARDLYERDPYYGADPYEVDPYARLRAASLYGRPPPEYYDRAGLAARDPYYERLLSQSAGASPADRELVSYPLPRTTAGYAKNPV